MMVAAAMEPASELAPLLLHLGERDALASPIAYMETCVINIEN